MRKYLFALCLLAAAACRQDPPGECGQHSDCVAGQECAGGLCVWLATDHQVGSRCVRESDCASWADCASGTCALTPGMCGSGADCATWQTCASHVCATAPGLCGDEADCTAWQDCGTDHLCALTPGMCADGADCGGWQVCDTNHACVLAPNGCENDAGCATWQTCASYRCATAPGFCAASSDCLVWQSCGTDHVCALTPGMCGTGADCAAWDVCDGTHTCVHGPGYCASGADCAAWQACDGVHACVTAPGYCDGAGPCAVWEVCNASHLCENGPGYCASGADCATWQQCNGVHACVTAPGYCASDGECATWQLCGADHVCATRPGRCAIDADCHAPQTCSGNSCEDPDPGILDPAAVYFMGVLDPSNPLLTGFARLDAPSSVLIGLPYTSPNYIDGGGPVFVSPNGDLVYTWYRHYGGPVIRRLKRDSLVWDPASQRWQYPSDPAANDEVVSTPVCTGGQTLYWVMREATGDILYNCDSTYDWYADGFVPEVSGFFVRSWNATGFFIGWRYDEIRMANPSGATVAITGLDTGYDRCDAWRAAEGGFHVVLHYPIAGAQMQLWHLANSGVATRVGIYPDLPPGVTEPSSTGVLDSAGAFYFKAKVVLENVVVKQTVAGEASFAYRQSSAPANADWSADPAAPWLFIWGLDTLATGP